MRDNRRYHQISKASSKTIRASMFCYTRKRRRKKKKRKNWRKKREKLIKIDGISKLKHILFSGSRLLHLLFFFF